MPKRSPRWYFSLRSPYSWIAYRDLMDRYPDVAAEIDWLPFWEPDEAGVQELANENIQLPYVTMSRAKHFYILQDVRRLATDRGLDMQWPVDDEPVWEVSHLAYLVAERLGQGRAFIDAVYRARWEEGKNISDPRVMAQIASELGLDEDQLTNASTDPLVRAEGMQNLRLLDRDGVFGVPFFIHGFDKFWGIDRLPMFVDAVRSKRVGAPTLTVPTMDQGHAGGCG